MLDFDEYLKKKKEHKTEFLYLLPCHKVEESLENCLFSVFLREFVLAKNFARINFREIAQNS